MPIPQCLQKSISKENILHDAGTKCAFLKMAVVNVWLWRVGDYSCSWGPGHRASERQSGREWIGSGIWPWHLTLYLYSLWLSDWLHRWFSLVQCQGCLGFWSILLGLGTKPGRHNEGCFLLCLQLLPSYNGPLLCEVTREGSATESPFDSVSCPGPQRPWSVMGIWGFGK